MLTSATLTRSFKKALLHYIEKLEHRLESIERYLETSEQREQRTVIAGEHALQRLDAIEKLIIELAAKIDTSRAITLDAVDRQKVRIDRCEARLKMHPANGGA